MATCAVFPFSALLPRLVARPARSGVINVSSASAVHGLPFNAVYAGSKVRWLQGLEIRHATSEGPQAQ
jgi:short-subunit dehydrogenase